MKKKNYCYVLFFLKVFHFVMFFFKGLFHFVMLLICLSSYIFSFFAKYHSSYIYLMCKCMFNFNFLMFVLY